VLLVVFVLTFLGASLFNIAAGEPFNPAQVLWDPLRRQRAVRLCARLRQGKPGTDIPHAATARRTVLSTGVTVTVGLVGLAITIGLLTVLELGASRVGAEVGTSVAFTAFALCLIVAAIECRSETGSVLTTATFDSKQLNWTILGEFVLAVLVTQMDVFNRLLDTTPLNPAQFGVALLPAIALLVLWELGKLVARRFIRHG